MISLYGYARYALTAIALLLVGVLAALIGSGCSRVPGQPENVGWDGRFAVRWYASPEIKIREVCGPAYLPFNPQEVFGSLCALQSISADEVRIAHGSTKWVGDLGINGMKGHFPECRMYEEAGLTYGFCSSSMTQPASLDCFDPTGAEITYSQVKTK